MNSFFTVDRTGRLKAGDVRDLQRHGDVKPPCLQSHLDELFPRGVSLHGEQYFVHAGSGLQHADPAVELVFEYVRRAQFEDRPSRFESIFGWISYAKATAFRNEFGQASDKIWCIECDRSFKANMRLLHGKDSILVVSYVASQYWRGLLGPTELGISWELLLVPPVRVIRAVT